MAGFEEAERQLQKIHTFETIQKLARAEMPGTVTPFYGEISRRGMAELLSSIELGATDRLLDFGCGVGRWLLEAAERGCVHVFGVEYVRERAEIAQRVLGARAVILQRDGNDKEVWELSRPSHVVAYDLLWGQEAREAFETTVLSHACVRWLVRFHKQPLRGFRLVRMHRVTTHPDEVETYTACVWARVE